MVRPLALLAAAAAAVVALWHLPGRFHAVNAQIADFGALTHQELELRAARGVDVDTNVLVRARELLPRGASFFVVTGPKIHVSTPVTLLAVPRFAAYYLAPRREVEDARAAQWVISYGGDLGKLGVRYSKIVAIEPGVWIAEVAR